LLARPELLDVEDPDPELPLGRVNHGSSHDNFFFFFFF
jgi:hypothetical protein